tara:strand:- start:1443 stop:1580 length:138 start_codon:yes stop_codon:yes gene_type:complete
MERAIASLETWSSDDWASEDILFNLEWVSKELSRFVAPSLTPTSI